MTGQAAPRHWTTVHCEAALLKWQIIFWLLFFFLIMWSCTDLIWAIQTVVMSITPQAGWHTPSAGTHVLIHGTWRDCWRRAKYISQHAAFSQLQITQVRPFQFLWKLHMKVMLPDNVALGEKLLELVTYKYFVLQSSYCVLPAAKCFRILGQ